MKHTPGYNTTSPNPVLERALACADGGRTTLNAIKEGHRPTFSWLNELDLVFKHRYLLFIQDLFQQSYTRNGKHFGFTKTGWLRVHGEHLSQSDWEQVESDFETLRPLFGHIAEEYGKYLELIADCAFLHHGYQIHHSLHVPLRSGVPHPVDAIVNLNRNPNGTPDWCAVECFYRTTGAKAKLKEDFRRLQETRFPRGLILSDGEELSHDDCAMTWEGRIQTYRLKDLIKSGMNLMSPSEYSAKYTNQYAEEHTRFAEQFRTEFAFAA